MEFPLTLRTAVTLAHELEDLFLTHCERFEIAGSIRRNYARHVRLPEAEKIIHDVELVVVPRSVPDPHKLFAECSDVDLLLVALRAEGTIADDPDHTRNGEKYKRFIYRRHCKVDLFIVTPPASFGALLAIRTGDKNFSTLLVTSRDQGGAMPHGLRMKHGGLCQSAKHHGDDKEPCTSDCRVAAETEAEFFERLELPTLPPERRNERKLRSLLNRKRSSHVSSIPQT